MSYLKFNCQFTPSIPKEVFFFFFLRLHISKCKQNEWEKLSRMWLNVNVLYAQDIYLNQVAEEIFTANKERASFYEGFSRPILGTWQAFVFQHLESVLGVCFL